MRIDQLMMTGFGRFQGRIIDLEPGLNVLYGPNEAGKTTVQKFILGMLYGFKKRGQRREYTEDAARYRPWSGSEYRGALAYTLELTDRRLRVEREFEPGRDAVRLYDAVTGADLSGQHSLDRRKELLFAEEQLHLPEEAFRSTAWVGQLGVSSLEAGRELVARVANLRESGREDLSVQAALHFLEERGKEIGSERAVTRPYGRVCRAIAESRAGLERARAAREQTLDWEARLAEVRGALAEMDEELAALNWRLDWAQATEAEQQLARVADAGRRAAALRERLSVAATFALDAAGEERLAGLREQEVRVVQALAELDQAPGDGGAPGTLRWGWVGAGAVLLTGALVAYSVGAGSLGAGSLGAGSQGAGTVGAGSPGAGTVGAVAVAAALAGALALACLLFFRERGKATRTRAIHQEQLAARREGQRARLEQIRAEMAALPREARARAASEAESLETALRSLVGGATEAELSAAADALRARLRGKGPAGDARSAADLREAIRRLEARRADRQATASDLGARVETVLGDLPDTADLGRELAALEEEKAGYDAELSALQLARDTLATVANEMHREFAPKLNQAMGTVVSELTGGRYNTVRIDDGMAVRALTADDRTVDLLSLSGGTVDQFYLGLRLALLGLVTDGQEPVPLILDDPFIQYDDERAAAAMAYLSAATGSQQVILMSCHQRELRLAEPLGARLITLDERRWEAT